MTSSACPRNRDGALWVEILLLTPVVVLVLMGVLELRQALQDEARLARTANQTAHARQEPAGSQITR